MRSLALAILVLALAPGAASASADESQRYLFYLHGALVEGTDGRPEHPEFGTYDYPGIVEAFENEGFTVISEIRPAPTDGMAYADEVVEQIRALLSEGVPAAHIAVVGHSKGGGIAVAVSQELGMDELRFVLTGTCVNWIQEIPDLTLRGRILSIHEESDSVAGPCAETFASTDVGPVFEELVLRTGKGHGTFYTPDPAWFEPAVQWCRGD